MTDSEHVGVTMAWPMNMLRLNDRLYEHVGATMTRSLNMLRLKRQTP